MHSTTICCVAEAEAFTNAIHTRIVKRVQQRSNKMQVYRVFINASVSATKQVALNFQPLFVLNRYEKADDLPRVRFPWQRWVLKAHESPGNEPRISTALNGKINWTMTYHRSADILYPIGFCRRRGSDDFGPFNVSTSTRGGKCDMYIFVMGKWFTNYLCELIYFTKFCKATWRPSMEVTIN